MKTQNDIGALLCDPEFLTESWQLLRTKGNTPGIDGIDLTAFAANAEEKIRILAKRVASGNYRPYPYRMIKIKKKDGGKRELAIPCVRDRIVQHAANRILNCIWDEYFMNSSFAYRKGRGTADAINETIRIIESGKTWYIKGDIHGCFDELDWEILSFLIKRWTESEILRKITEDAYRSPISIGDRLIHRNKGVPQGSALSPILANLYLHTLDYGLALRGIDFVRYADDWLLLCRDERDMAENFSIVSRFSEDLKIELNLDKTDIGDLKQESIQFLGYTVDAWSATDNYRPSHCAHYTPGEL